MVEAQAPAANVRKKRLALVIFALALIIFLVALFFYNRYASTHISTDDAFVESSVYTISSRVTGTVKRVLVKDNSPVKAGDLLVELDPDTYSEAEKEAASAAGAERSRVAEVEAAIVAGQKRVQAALATYQRALTDTGGLNAALKARSADVEAKKALFHQAELDLKRAEELLKAGVLPQASADRARTAFDTASSELTASKEALEQSRSALKSHNSAVEEAKALLSSERADLDRLRATLKTQKELVKNRDAAGRLAGLNLSYTRIYAPANGYVTRKNVEAGNHAEAGSPLMAIVSLDGVYVVANYKETSVHLIRPGQKVRISVDTYPGHEFEGHVDSIMAGTGSAFSLFPPENATGNYVKVVQRVPVKILIDKGIDSSHALRVGMSVVPTVLAE